MSEVRIRKDGHSRVPSPVTVPIRAGERVTFTTEADAGCTLYFSDGSTSVFTPEAPSSLDIAGGSSVSLTFSDSDGPACILVLATGEPAPRIIDCDEPSGTLRLSYSKSRSGPDILTDPMGSGT
jgi:hypothetical protein